MNYLLNVVIRLGSFITCYIHFGTLWNVRLLKNGSFCYLMQIQNLSLYLLKKTNLNLYLSELFLFSLICESLLFALTSDSTFLCILVEFLLDTVVCQKRISTVLSFGFWYKLSLIQIWRNCWNLQQLTPKGGFLENTENFLRKMSKKIFVKKNE